MKIYSQQLKTRESYFISFLYIQHTHLQRDRIYLFHVDVNN